MAEDQLCQATQGLVLLDQMALGNEVHAAMQDEGMLLDAGAVVAAEESDWLLTQGSESGPLIDEWAVNPSWRGTDVQLVPNPVRPPES